MQRYLVPGERAPGAAFREPSGRACNSYELWREDVDLVAGLGLDAYRFSVEWARVELTEGEFSAEALAHYRAIDGPLPRGGDRAGGHLQPLHRAALVRQARRVARPAGSGAVRPVLRRRRRAPAVTARPGPSRSTSRTSPACSAGSTSPAAARDLELATSGCRERGGRGTAATGPPTWCSWRRWTPSRAEWRPGTRRRGGHQGPAARAAGRPQPGDRGRPGGWGD